MEALALARMTDTDNHRVTAAVVAQTPRLRAFVRSRVADLAEADDIVQETFYELVAAYRLMQPIEHVASWLVRVARNRIIDRFRSRSLEAAVLRPAASQSEPAAEGTADERSAPHSDGPEAAYVRGLLADELEAALDELPSDQREVFVAHEFEGRSFRDLAAASGLSVNTLLWRKQAAVRHLRRRLQSIYEEFSD